MAKQRTYFTSAAWFGQWPVIDPPGWDDKDGWCRRHFAPVTQISDPAARETVTRLASLDIMESFARSLRGLPRPLPGPISVLLRDAAPVCCTLGDDEMWTIILKSEAIARRYHGARALLWTVPQ